jgi:hypothetical protein
MAEKPDKDEGSHQIRRGDASIFSNDPPRRPPKGEELLFQTGVWLLKRFKHLRKYLEVR